VTAVPAIAPVLELRGITKQFGTALLLAAQRMRRLTGCKSSTSCPHSWS
jgi:hypothetical protein